MTARLADESGFTLVELLVTMIVATIVLLALFAMLDTTTRQQHRAVERVDANDRGRLAIDVISAQLRSRVCIKPAQGLVLAASANQIEFFASLALTPGTTTTGQSLVLERRRLTYRPAPDNDIREERWTVTAPASEPLVATTPATSTRTILTNVSLAGTAPFFRYYADAGTPPLPPPTQLLTPPLSATNLTDIARIDVSFAANSRVAGVGSQLKNQILDRSSECLLG